MKNLMRKAAMVLLIMSLMTTTAFAGSTQENCNPNEVPRVHAELEKRTEKVSNVESEILKIGEAANISIAREIDKAIAKADGVTDDKKIAVIIRNLMKKTEQISAEAIKKINRLGGVAICEWVEVEIGGQTILVDPIRIVRLR